MSIAVNPQCYEALHEKFQYLLEDDLIREICQFGQLNKYRPDTTIIDIGEKINAMPLIVSGAIKVMTEDEEGNELLLYYLELGDTCCHDPQTVVPRLPKAMSGPLPMILRRSCLYPWKKLMSGWLRLNMEKLYHRQLQHAFERNVEGY